MTTAPTNFNPVTMDPKNMDPNTMDPATVVLVYAGFGDTMPSEARLPQWHVGAVAALCDSRLDVPRALAMVDFMRDRACSTAGHERLVDAAHWVSGGAQRCRHARWYNSPPERIPDTAFEAVADGSGYVRSFTSNLSEAHDALAMREPTAWRDTGGPAVQERVRDLCFLLLLHPNISPATELGLAPRGFTAAEYLISSAAAIVGDLARMYAAATGDTRDAFHRAGKHAAALARHAQQTIEEGVRHTLGVPPRAALMA